MSEGDTVILGAATKGQKAKQPNSDIDAPTRGFSLKNSFFRGVLRSHVERTGRGEKSSVFVTPEGYIWNQLKSYKGMSQLGILNLFQKHDPAKRVPNSISKMVSDRIVGTDKELPEKHEVFSKSNFLIKNIPIREDNSPIEKATFRTLQIADFETSWEESPWKTFFEEVTFIYVGYLGEKDGKKLGNGHRILDRIFKVTFTSEEVDEFEKTYNMIKVTIDTQDIRKLPTASHELGKELKLVVSTKGSGSGGYKRFLDDTRETCFMLNKDFVHQKLNEAVILK